MKKKRFKLSKAQAKAFLATEKGQLWLEAKMKAKRRPRLPAHLRYGKTRFPFIATINGREALVDVRDGEIVIEYDDFDREAWQGFQ